MGQGLDGLPHILDIACRSVWLLWVPTLNDGGNVLVLTMEVTGPSRGRTLDFSKRWYDGEEM